MKKIIISLIFILVLPGCRMDANFHEVDPGKFYRSAQLKRVEFETALKKGIRTVINLRGKATGQDWYKMEKELTRKYGAKLINIAMSPSEIPTKENLRKLVGAYEDSERPILVHCEMGADRTGEASAIYSMDYMGASVREALDQLTPEYQHFEGVFPAKRYFIESVYRGSDWTMNEYEPCDSHYPYFNRKKRCK